jgi:hypothetical protein
VAGSDLALMFLDALDWPERLACLHERLGRVEAHIARLERVPTHHHQPSVNLALQRQLVLLRADRDWLEGLIQQWNRSLLPKPKRSSGV